MEVDESVMHSLSSCRALTRLSLGFVSDIVRFSTFLALLPSHPLPSLCELSLHTFGSTPNADPLDLTPLAACDRLTVLKLNAPVEILLFPFASLTLC